MQTIILDLDDTTANLRDPMSMILNKYTGKNIHWNEWCEFDIISLYGLTVQEFYNCINESNILENLIPHDGAKELLTDLKNSGYTTKIITARGYNPNALEITKEWFAKYKIPFDEIIICNHGEKCNFITKEENVVLAIDDSITNCIEFLQSGKVSKVYLHDMPWNQQSSIARVASLSEVRQLLHL